MRQVGEQPELANDGYFGLANLRRSADGRATTATATAAATVTVRFREGISNFGNQS